MANNNGGCLTGLGATILILVVAFPIPAIVIGVLILIACFLFPSNSSSGGSNNNYYGNSNYYNGLTALNNKNYQKAIELFTDSLHSSYKPVPTDDIYVMRGIAYSNVKEDEKALQDFNKAISMFSFDNPTAFLERGKIYARRNEFNKALKDYNKAINMNFGLNGDDYFYRGLLYLKMGNKTDALKDFESTINLAKTLKPEIVSKCKSLINELKNKITEVNKNTNNQTPKKKKGAKNKVKIVDLKICRLTDLLLLDGFDEEKANRFMQQRENGVMWYDIDSFVRSFNIQPHEMILIQDKIKFPPKPSVKMGQRRVDL